MSTTFNHFAGWTTTRLNGKTVWVESFEAATHFQRKATATKELASLRELSIIGAKNGATEEAMLYLQGLMLEATRKVIAANRKAQNKGWYVIDDERMQQYKKDVA